MWSKRLRSEKGQNLVLLAGAMFMLFAILAVAIEIGHVYLERRAMQNAADAGALAGAWEICFGDPAFALSTAEEYARDRNLAPDVDATHPDGENWRVNVVASETMNTFVAGIIGVPTMDVGAEAEAACTGARNLCGVWPITFRQERWDEMPACPDNDNVKFVVWNDDKFEETEPVYIDPGTSEELYLCDVCECENLPEFGAPDGNYFVIGPGQRGWINLPRPTPPYEDEERCTNNCGSNQSVCIIDNDGGYEGLVSYPVCLPSQPGVSTNILHAIERNLNEEVNILIWDRECSEGEEITGECPGDPAYHIVKTGCAAALEVLSVDLPLKSEFSGIPGSASWCPSNVKAVLMEKHCACESTCGSTTGTGPPAPGEVRAVSLTK